MAAKKKTAPKKKKAPAPARPARKAAKPAAAGVQPSVSVEPEAKVSGLGKFIVVLALLLLVLVLFMALRKPSADATPAATAAPAPAATAAPAPAAPATAEPKDDAIPAAATAPKVSSAKPGDEDGTGLTLKSGATMTLRCWRKQDDQATLDVFGQHNKPVAHLASDTGPAGWAHLTWKAQDDSGQNLAPGVYYLRPSTPGAQKLVAVTLEP
jgi:hypothetical protein